LTQIPANETNPFTLKALLGEIDGPLELCRVDASADLKKKLIKNIIG